MHSFKISRVQVDIEDIQEVDHQQIVFGVFVGRYSDDEFPVGLKGVRIGKFTPLELERKVGRMHESDMLDRIKTTIYYDGSTLWVHTTYPKSRPESRYALIRVLREHFQSSEEVERVRLSLHRAVEG